MSRTVTVGLDGSPESLAAADWAAREAHLRAVPLRVVHAGEQQPHAYAPFATEAVALPGDDRSARMLHDAEVSLTYRHPGLRITAEQLSGQPTTVLSAAAREVEVLVLGSRGLGRAAGRLFGSVALPVVGRAEGPIVLVRAGAGVVDEHRVYRADTRGGIRGNPVPRCRTRPCACRDALLRRFWNSGSTRPRVVPPGCGSCTVGARRPPRG